MGGPVEIGTLLNWLIPLAATLAGPSFNQPALKRGYGDISGQPLPPVGYGSQKRPRVGIQQALDALAPVMVGVEEDEPRESKRRMLSDAGDWYVVLDKSLDKGVGWQSFY